MEKFIHWRKMLEHNEYINTEKIKCVSFGPYNDDGFKAFKIVIEFIDGTSKRKDFDLKKEFEMELEKLLKQLNLENH